ncbi:MAG: energy-coupling factor ABC transporter ATP-binding protein, partial [Oscillospiraceae bacterium]|nr:energy-coupling factor ABC transporter ATP-binding protein [Oscillospiraceae bacterium]
MIRIDNVTYTYPKGERPALSCFSADFQRGEITAVSGRNGCGKTTLTKLAAGLLRPSAGRVLIDGEDIRGLDLPQVGKKAGYIFQNPNRQLFCDTVYNETAYGLRSAGVDERRIGESVDFYLDYFGLSAYRDVYPGKLSLGEKQRLALAAVLILGTDYLILDEPTTGLDVCR